MLPLQPCMEEMHVWGACVLCEPRWRWGGRSGVRNPHRKHGAEGAPTFNEAVQEHPHPPPPPSLCLQPRTYDKQITGYGKWFYAIVRGYLPATGEHRINYKVCDCSCSDDLNRSASVCGTCPSCARGLCTYRRNLRRRHACSPTLLHCPTACFTPGGAGMMADDTFFIFPLITPCTGR